MPKKITETLAHLHENSMPEPNSGCWLWLLSVDGKGHGKMSGSHRTRSAHRVSWRLHRGPIPAGICVCHKCDVRSCVNPDHLFLGTHQDNVLDMIAKGRAPKRCGGNGLFGGRRGFGRITISEDRVRGIRAATGLLREIAAKFDVSITAASRIRLGKRRSTVASVEG